MSTILNEGLGYQDMKGQVLPLLGIDQYSSSIGSDDAIVTLSFTTKQKQVSKDLASWLEKGYDWVIDADVSPGEVARNKYLTFAEMSRRSRVPEHIVEMLDDLQTLTDIDGQEWQIKIGDQILPATADNIRQHLALSPHQYREENESELNEMRQIAGIPLHATREQDTDMLEIQRAAGIR